MSSRKAVVAFRSVTDSSAISGPLRWIVVLIIVAALCVASFERIDGSAVTADAAQNLLMAVNLSHHGTMSLDEAAPYRPSMYREPLPVAVGAALVSIEDHFLGQTDAAKYVSGERVKDVKYQNILWLIALWLAVFAATRWLSGSFIAAVVSALLAVRPFLGSSSAEGINNLYTELPGAALLTVGSLTLAMAAMRGRWSLIVAAGVCMGLASLTKATTLYVFAAIAIVLAAACLSKMRGARFGQLCLLMVSFLVVVAPWLARNLLAFGQLQIAERGGLALYTRALYDQMTPLEYRGSFYVWAPQRLQPRLGSLLGFTARDLDGGGRLQRLNEITGSALDQHDLAAEAAGRPQDAVTFFYQARAMRERLEDGFEQTGDRYPDVSADHVLQGLGLRMIKHELWGHVAATVPLLWRSAATVFPLLLVGLAYSLRVRRYALALFIFASFATLCFYALVTPYWPRASIVVHGVAATVLLALLSALWRWLTRREHAATGENRPLAA